MRPVSSTGRTSTLSRLFSAAFLGVEALPVEIEVDLAAQKNSSIRIVGLPDAAVKESKDRVLHAIKNSGFTLQSADCIVHLAPANLKKVGAFYDLPIALGILHSLGLFKALHLEEYLIGGELSLEGELRPIFGALALALLARQLGKKGVCIPRGNLEEVALVKGIEVIPVRSLKEAVAFFQDQTKPSFTLPEVRFIPQPPSVDMADVKGQAHAKRALEIAAAGRHNVLMSGPPGTGKTLLAKAFIGILPELSLEEALEISSIHTLAGVAKGLVKARPFRSPHHTISFAGMVGGGSQPKPGEISLAHRGVLFLDELPEFSRATLEVLRQPLEDRVVTVSRAGGKVTFPTDIICIAAMNPCPCGYLGHPEKPCRDSAIQVERYRQKISGPLLDRIDLHLQVPPVSYQELYKTAQEENSETIRERVKAAYKRRQSLSVDPDHLNPACRSLLKESIEAFGLSARAHARLLSVALTIAALDQQDQIEEHHLAEALSYRPL